MAVRNAPKYAALFSASGFTKAFTFMSGEIE
ncbi:hypothetical protein EDB47_11736 [Vibrio crassostreae]|nr:hypothetical protein EDB44_1181 [Vibrio crassostreae]TCT80181.1 hypothetical protein EDB43_1181 [Vibrio crassostreae]TCU01540.1 hypothetical protein EDB47_11736 [Vibrio crassostreae]